MVLIDGQATMGELDVPDTNVGDMISRQAAIDALDVLCQEHRYKIPGKVETYSQYNEAWQDALDRAEGAIFNLPPVQPKHGRWIERNPLNSDKCRLIECDQCGKSYIVSFNVPYEHWIENKNYCEKCGADMRGNEDGAD